ncbi:TPA: hypothetical protein I7702_21445 [Vibrio vulnificus]|nr:hypothetical protein [Vibrio vulnificus]HAS8416131.1 hypothetical protein [Vibrio vulnificus]HAS8461473.1 hypothetical protein [Vibrio vulnificus]
MFFSPSHRLLLWLKHNAALSGEQRRPPHLNHCAVNTKAESNPKCRALGIRLERFVSPVVD